MSGDLDWVCKEVAEKEKATRDEIPGMKLKVSCVFIITDKTKLVGEEVKGVGVMAIL